MSIAKVTSKGQVTIPKQVREGLNLHNGDKIDIVLEDDGSARIYPISRSIDSVIGIVKTGKKLTDKQIRNAVLNKIRKQKK